MKIERSSDLKKEQKRKRSKGSEAKDMREDSDQEILYQHTFCVKDS